MKELINRVKLYFPIPFVIALVCAYLTTFALFQFFNRDDLCEYIQTHKVWISALAPIFMILLFIAIFCTILCFLRVRHIKKQEKK